MIKNNYNLIYFFNILKLKLCNKRNKYVLNKDYMDYIFVYFVVWSIFSIVSIW